MIMMIYMLTSRGHTNSHENMNSYNRITQVVKIVMGKMQRVELDPGQDMAKLTKG